MIEYWLCIRIKKVYLLFTFTATVHIRCKIIKESIFIVRNVIIIITTLLKFAVFASPPPRSIEFYFGPVEKIEATYELNGLYCQIVYTYKPTASRVDTVFLQQSVYPSRVTFIVEFDWNKYITRFAIPSRVSRRFPNSTCSFTLQPLKL